MIQIGACGTVQALCEKLSVVFLFLSNEASEADALLSSWYREEFQDAQWVIQALLYQKSHVFPGCRKTIPILPPLLQNVLFLTWR